MSKTAVAPFHLNFTRQVLGEKATYRLQNQRVSQTIRSQSESIVDEVLHSRLKVGDVVEVALNDELVGTSQLVSVDRVTWNKLTQEDAARGGFDTIGELQNALLRAGFRFKPIESYLFYRIRFQWR